MRPWRCSVPTFADWLQYLTLLNNDSHILVLFSFLYQLNFLNTMSRNMVYSKNCTLISGAFLCIFDLLSRKTAELMSLKEHAG